MNHDYFIGKERQERNAERREFYGIAGMVIVFLAAIVLG